MREMWRTPAGRGFIMLAVMSAALGFAMNAHNNLITNYFNDVLLLSGPQFGYITAIREIGGFVIIFLTAVFYRVSLQHLTAGAIVVLAIGYGLFSIAGNFWTIIPWVLITSFGMHTVLQTQIALAMTLTTASKSGAVLGKLGAFSQGGTLAALVMIFLIFKFEWLSYRPTFIILGAVAFVAALAVARFPHLHEGQARKLAPKREPLVWSRHYRLYYWLSLLDGARQQVFFSFGLWVLVNRFGLGVSEVSLVLLAVTFLGVFISPWLGRAVDHFGERRSLSVVNVAFIVALGGFALADGVVLACIFYCLYLIIVPVAYIGGSTYVRKICAPQDLSATLAMGLTVSHATSIVVPVAAGFILNYVGYQIPFYAACGVAVITFFVTLRLDPVKQRCPARIAADEAIAAQPAVRPAS
ncbi:MAG: MFS transporter [Thermoleophilia bacterium]|nr:MFS transporter [Thermoleophilia bacterium]